MIKRFKQRFRGKEERVHTAVCNYLRLQYPDVIFTSESAGIRLTIGQAAKVKKLRSEAALPDLWIAEPRGGYCGLFLELKRDQAEVYDKRGKLRQTPHIKAQNAMLIRLLEKGYYAAFGCGFDDAKKVIDSYMDLEKTKKNN